MGFHFIPLLCATGKERFHKNSPRLGLRNPETGVCRFYLMLYFRHDRVFSGVLQLKLEGTWATGIPFKKKERFQTEGNAERGKRKGRGEEWEIRSISH